MMWSTSASVFKRGSAVEVSSEDEGLRGSWYTATVVDNSGAKLLVEYHNLLSDEDDSSKLREKVDPILVRPVPPLDPNPVFSLMDDVDAFHNDGWWEGVVTSLLPPHSYSVFFRCSREQLDFPASDLRLHREWLGSHLWRPPFHPHPHPPPPPPPPPSSSSSSSSSRSRQKRKTGDGGLDDGGGRKTIRHGSVARTHLQPAPPHSPCSPGMRSRTPTLLCNYTPPHITRNASLTESPPRAASLSGRRTSTH